MKAVWDRALSAEEFTAVDEFGDPSRDRRAYEMRYNTLRDRDGNRIGAYQFVYDVTERLREQERLPPRRGRASPATEDGVNGHSPVAWRGMKDGEFEMLPKPYTLEGVAEALGVQVK